MPRTPIVLAWWAESFTRSLSDPSDRTFVVRLKEGVDSEGENVVGAIRLKRFTPDEKGAGFWTRDGFSEDHDKELCLSFIEPMIEWRERLLQGRAHYRKS
jgi:hypothetical protein